MPYLRFFPILRGDPPCSLFAGRSFALNEHTLILRSLGFIRALGPLKGYPVADLTGNARLPKDLARNASRQTSLLPDFHMFAMGALACDASRPYCTSVRKPNF